MDYKAGMFVYALAFLLGVISVQQLTVLPTLTQLLILLLAVFFLLCATIVLVIKQSWQVQNNYFTLTIAVILLFTIGIVTAVLYSKQQLSYRLDEALTGKNLLVNGYISNIPTVNEKVQRFEFYVESYRILGSDRKTQLLQETTLQFPRKIRLSWYYGSPVNAADKWQFEVRLKPPHGFINPGGFDYEGWLFQHGLHATGYVRKSALNLQQDAVVNDSLLGIITGTRQQIGRQIDAIAADNTAETTSFALIKALAIGDKSSISKQQWHVLTATGTSHLMAISGLHIGLAALFAFVLIRRLVPAFIVKRVPAQYVALSGGLVVALLYALIAGFSVPTQRAFIMLSILSIMILIRRNHRPVDALGFALLIVLLIDPLAVLSAGFWFSFSAVAVIFISLSSRSTDISPPQTTQKVLFLMKVVSTVKQWIRLQLLISAFLLPLSLFMFQQVSLISPVANLLLIPYVSFLVVPVVLLGLSFSFILPEIAVVLFNLSAVLLDLIWPVLSYFSAQPYALWVQGDVGIFKLLAATAALCLMYFSKPATEVIVSKFLKKRHYTNVYRLLRVIAFLMFVPVFISGHSSLNPGEYKVTVLDVGQGSAAVLQTQNHVVVIDTGAKFSDKLDAGSSVVIPYLRSQGIQSIDSLIISHGDSDHIGGAQAVLAAYPETDVIGQHIDGIDAANKQGCFEGMKWQWDGVNFEFLSPLKGDAALFSDDKRNNQSCVLHVSSKAGVVLFTGDIEKKVERQLLSRRENQLAADVLIVPHHGSKTSSSPDFINAVNAKYSLFSVGYKNRYKLPNHKIVSRYQVLESELLRTDKSGAITIQLTESDGLLIEKYREKAMKYWHHRLN
ncbi:MAG: DNA internalization-related competence protein ComEC/Rec2 [Gammaproteobacteria bacterium]